MTITPDILVRAGLTTPEMAAKVAAGLDAACKRFGIVTPHQVAAFLAQCAQESCGFRTTVEGLNYSAQGLLDTWPKKFDAGKAAAYAKQAERIASYVYGGRMENGPEPTKDGWKYRGRGFIQLTGKRNYRLFSKAAGVDAVQNPDMVATPEYAALSAAWFWSANNLNAMADTPDVTDETKVINGGTLGLKQRQRYFDKALQVLGSVPATLEGVC